MADKSKILVIGATGYIGKYLVEESAKSGHPTFALIRESAVSDPEKSKIIDSFKSLGVTLIYGDIYDHELLVKAIKKVDVVISGVGFGHIADQVNIIAAIKEAGTVKRFLPSEFGSDVDRSRAVEPAATLFGQKAKIRRAIEAEGIPYTYVMSHAFIGYSLYNLLQTNLKAPPRDQATIIGDGNVKAIFVKEEDIATYTIKAVDDPRTLNKGLHIIPPTNIMSFNELVSLWEKKIGKTLERTYTSEDQILKMIQESPPPKNIFLSIAHSVYLAGNFTCLELESSSIEASKLYPEVKYITVDEYLNQFV